MEVEYVSMKVSALRWLPSDYLRSASNPTRQFWMCGETGEPANAVTVWSNQDEGGEPSMIDGGKIQLGMYCMKPLRYVVGGDVIDIATFDRKSVMVTTAKGDIFWLRFATTNGQIELIHKWTGAVELGGHNAQQVLANDQRTIISAGLDGHLKYFDLEGSPATAVISSAKVVSNSLHCLDKISPTEVVTGTSSGHLKVYDRRADSVTLSLANHFSIITSVQRHPHLPHIVAAANDEGLLNIWDLRNGGERPMQPASAHKAAINRLAYSESNSNIIVTCGDDGQLIKWNINNEFVITSVDTLVDKNNAFPISCFDIHANTNQIVFADDNDVMYLTNI